MKQYKSTMRLFELKKINSDFLKTKITDSKMSDSVIRQFYYDDIEIYESMFVLLLNKANITIGYFKLSQGGINSTVFDIKLLAKYAIDSLASGVIIAHNHPSGNNKPSDNDKSITRIAVEGLKLLEINVIDSLILTVDSYYSFADNGLL